MIKLEEFLRHILPNRIFLLLKNFLIYKKYERIIITISHINCVPKTFLKHESFSRLKLK